MPYVAVIGDNELESEELTINIRETQEKQAMTREDLVKLVKEETNDMPFRALQCL